MGFSPLSVLLIFAIGPLRCFATFAPRWDDVQAKHTWSSIPENWQNLGHPPAGTTVDLHVALKAQNETALIDALHEVSNPGNPKYGAHLSREQVAELAAPAPDVLQLVGTWLKHHGVPSSTIATKHGGSWLTLTGVPVSRANELLSASYQLYQHIGTNETVLRTLSYGLPTALITHVQTVAPTTHFGSPRTSRQKPLMRPDGAAGVQTKVPAGEPRTVLTGRDESPPVTPSFLRRLYKTSRYVPFAADRNMLGVVGFLDQYPSPDDLTLFMNQYRSDATSATFKVVPDDPFVNWLDYVLVQEKVPQTISINYGAEEYKVPPDHAGFVCNLFAWLGMRGASVLLSSGDDGVGLGSCLFTDGYGNSRVKFVPTFPSTCPWITSVGATTGYYPEVAASLSGGGFSVYFPRPPYQNQGVPDFLRNLGSQYSDFYNPGGCGVPDISLQAINYLYVLNKQPWTMTGTSCSTPTAAGIISLLNDYMISTGRRPLGFLNFWLYGRGLSGLNDITSGSNPGCKTDGFSAVPGWDPVRPA
ncbi:subtilisin-like protein [Lactarius indigo]|nr:subtilisin-like protein [Lactarius indigo]